MAGMFKNTRAIAKAKWKALTYKESSKSQLAVDIWKSDQDNATINVMAVEMPDLSPSRP